LLRWLKNRTHAGPSDVRSGDGISGDHKPSSPAKFRLEQLEPRVLLSGDTPLVAEVYRSLVDDKNDVGGAEYEATILQLDAATSAEIAASSGADFGAAQNQITANVVWPEGWQSAAAEDKVEDNISAAATLDVAAAAADNTDVQSAEVVMLQQAATTTDTPKNIDAADDNSSAALANQDYLASTVPVTELPTGPPADGQITSALVAEDALNYSELSLSNSSVADEGEVSSVQFLLVSDVNTDSLARAPPAENALTEQSITLVLQEAIRIWTAAGLTSDQARRLADLQVLIADLPDGELGTADQNLITLDATAAGRGWFVDTTPDDNSEFLTTLSEFRSAANAGSDAFGRIDLLTVLLHEIGHVLGYGHDAGLAVMDENLGSGQRVRLDANAAGLAWVAGGTVADGSHVSPTLDLSGAANDVATINIQVNLDGTLNVSGTETGDNLSNIAGITNIIGNASATITLAGPDKNVTWTLSTANTGTMAISGGPTITFTNIDKIRGGSGDDRIVIRNGTTSAVEFNGQGGFDSVVNEADKASGTTFLSVENFIDRPLLFVPGFGGSFVNTSGDGQTAEEWLQEWYLTRGMDPTKLALEPLSNSYSDMVQTLVNTGYTDGTNTGVNGTLYVSLWDYRVPVAITADPLDDGVLSDVTAASLRDWAFDSFDSGLDYFAYWMDQAAQAWQALTGSAATSVDVITHSTGGLVVRSYLQSDAYDHNAPADNMLAVNTLIQTGVPNQGLGGIFSLLINDFGQTQNSRLFALMVNGAYELVMAGAEISNPDDSTIDAAALTAMGMEQFIAGYVGTLQDLLAVYNFLDDVEDSGEVYTALSAAAGGNSLLFDLNAVGPADFVGIAAKTYVVYSSAVDTPDLVIKHTGIVPALGTQNEILPFTNVIGVLPPSGQAWYEVRNTAGGGDGTVSAFSASDGFDGKTNGDGTFVLFEVTAAAAGVPVGHSEILYNTYSQGQVLRLLGIAGYQFASKSTELLLSTKDAALNAIAIGLIDPIEVVRQAFVDTTALVGDIQTRLTTVLGQELPVIGMSLNDLLTSTGFNLFEKISSALAPAAGVVSELGTLTVRLAQLEELLEDAFLLVDVGPSSYDNPEVELIYDATAVSLTMVFDFDLTDVTVNEFGLELGVGLAFSVTIDIGDLISMAAGGSGNGGSRLSLDLTTSVALDTDKVDFAGVATVGILLSDLYSGEVPDITLTGEMTLDVDGYVLVAGAFSLSQTTAMVDLFGSGAVEVDLLRLDLTHVDLFVGVGGVFDSSNPDHYDVVTTDATGFFVNDASLTLAIASLADASSDTRTWIGVVASASNLGPVGLPTGYTVTVNNLLVLYNSASGTDAGDVEASRIDWSVIYASALDPLHAVTAVTEFSVEGDLVLDMNGYVMVAGGFSVTKATPTVDLPGETGAVLTVLRIELTNVDLFVGVGGVFDTTDPNNYDVDVTNATGFLVDNADLSIAIASLDNPTAGDTRRWLGFAASASGMGPEGLPDNFDIRVDNLLALSNSASGKDSLNVTPARLNWSAIYTDAADPLNALTGATVFSVEGDVTLNLGGYVMVAGGLSVSRTTQTGVDLMDDGVLVDLDLLRIDLTGVDLFVGVGGVFDTDTEGDYGVVATDDVATGFLVANANLYLAIASVTNPTPENATTDTRRWTGIVASASKLTPVGMPTGFVFNIADVEVLFNSASGNDGAVPSVDAEKIDWAVLYTDASDPLNALEATTGISVSGYLTVQIASFVQIRGGFAFTQSSGVEMILAGDTNPTEGSLITLGFGQLNVFVGDGPYFVDNNGDTVIDANDTTPNADAMGLLLKNTTIAVALFKPTTGTGSYYAVSAFAEDFEPLGLDLGTSGTFDLSASGYRIEVNGGSGGGAMNFAALPAGKLVVATGAVPVEFKYSTALLRLAIEDARLEIADYVYVSGGFAFTRQTNMDVALSGGGNDNVNVLAFGAGNVDVFVGSGPYFQDGKEERDPNAIGLALENVNFGLLLMKSTNNPATKYTALMVTADRVGLVGLDSLILTAAGVTVEYNSSKRPVDNKVIDFSGDPYFLDTGNGVLEINYDSKVLRASVEDAQLQIGSYVFIRGGLAFEKGGLDESFNLTVGAPTIMSTINVGAQDLTMFFGVDGPYWTDLDGDGAISWSDADGNTLTQLEANSADDIVDVGETAELNPNAVGLAITNANFAMTLVKPKVGATKYLALHATADQLGFVGIDAFQLEASRVVVDLNLALGGGATSLTPVINFASTYPDERQALFDFLADGDDTITVGELDAAFGVGFGTEELTTVEQLMTLLDIGGAPPDGVLSVTEVIDQLNNTLPLSELEALTDLILALDADGDGKFDPIGYEVKTGSGSFYLSADHRQIHASADNVLINVAEFVYVQGSIALDIGSREFVTINTGIPASVGTLASAAVAAVNNALDDLKVALDTLRAEVETTIRNAIGSLRTQINNLVDGLIDSIVARLKVELEYVGSVGAVAQDQLLVAIAAIGDLVNTALGSLAGIMSFDGLIDQAIQPVLDALPSSAPGPIRDLLGLLLSPIREKINAEFGGALQEALTDAISRITASVSEVVESALDAAAGAALASLDAAIDAKANEIKLAIHGVLDPQFDRVDTALEKLILKITGKLDALFERLYKLTDIEVGDNFSTLENVEVEVTALGISNAYAFVGLPPSDGFDFTEPLSEQIGEAIGLYVDHLNLALGIFKPVLSKQLPNFTALKFHADEAGFSDGDPTGNVLELFVRGIDVELNLGGPIVQAAGALFGNATIDFEASFSEVRALFDTDLNGEVTVSELRVLAGQGASGAFTGLYTAGTLGSVVVDLDTIIAVLDGAGAGGNSDGKLQVNEAKAFLFDDSKAVTADKRGDGVLDSGYPIQTSTTGDPVYIDFADGEIIRASVAHANLQISEFVHITGSIAFEKGAIETVDVTDGLTGPAVDTVLAGLGLNPANPLMAGLPWAGGDQAELSFMTIGASNVHAFVGIGGPYWTDADFDDVVDLTELSASAKGLWIQNFDFGMAIMKPTNPLDFVKYFALKASADQISIVNIEGVEITAHDLLVEINQSTPGVYGLPLFPVVDFASTYQSEQQALFDLLKGSDNKISVAEQAVAFTNPGATDLMSADQLVKLLDTGKGSPGSITPDGMLTVKEVLDRLTATFNTAHPEILSLDADNDGKFDPAGYEVNTGGTPVYLAMSSSLIRAQGFVQLNLFDTVYLSGSVAFELGPTQEVTLSDSTEADPSTKTVTTMTIGAANITAFIGANGPYWTDLNFDHEVTRDPSVADNGNGRIDANESLELNDASAGFEITDLDIGIMVMASVDPADLGVYLAAKLNVNSFGLIGIAGLTATGAFDVALNVGVSMSGLDLSLAVVDFSTSFSEAPALFALLDTDHIGASNGVIDQTEQEAALAGGYSGQAITTASQLVTLLNTSGGPPDAYLTMVEVNAKLKDTFKTTHQVAIDALDVDANGRLNTGFEVNTGNPAAPVVLDFDQFFISIKLGGEIELDNVFRLYGVFLFEVDSSGLKAFVAAGLEIGPDIDSTSKIFTMNALGALVINAAGVAADLSISISIGGALSDVLQLDATARLVFNTTGANQSITIPAQYADFLFGNSAVPSSAAFDSTLVSNLKFTAGQPNLTVNSDGSVTYTISGTAPGGSSPGFYLSASFDAKLTIIRAFEIQAHFSLLLTAQKFDLGFTGSLKLGAFGSFGVAGGIVIDANGFAAYGTLTFSMDFTVVQVSGSANLKINTGSSPVTVNGVTINANTYKVTVDAHVTLFTIISARGEVSIGVENGVFEIAVNKLKIDLYILEVEISGYIRSNGQFNLTGSLSIGDALSSGDWGITGGLSVSISNSGFTGHGSVGIKLFGQSFNIASATLSITSDSFFIRAEGPLGIWISVRIDSNGSLHFDGGLGFLDDIIGAIADVANAVGDAIVEAANVVAAAFEELGEAILDLGAAIGDAIVGFVSDVAGFLEDLGGAIAEAFSSSRTILRTVQVLPKYSYSADWLAPGSTTLVIDMTGGTLTGVESPLTLAVVDGKLIVDGPNKTVTIKVAEKQRQTRSWSWSSFSWSSWRDSGDPFGEVLETIEYSNMRAFSGVTKVIIHGTNGDDTIVLDKTTITSIAAEVYGYGGADTIITGGGNDTVYGGDGNDTIFTYGGNDVIHGGLGDDKLAGGIGNDSLYGDGGDDLLNESLDRGNNSKIVLTETNLLDGGADDDKILGSPGIDTIVGGSGNDMMTGLNNNDTFVFDNGYGTDTFADYYGKAYLDFSGVTSNLAISISDAGLTVDDLNGNVFSVEGFIALQQQEFLSKDVPQVLVKKFIDFQIVELKTGTENDHVAVTALPHYRMDIIDAGGSDTYDFDFDAADVAQDVARVNIVDTSGNTDQIDLDVDSTGFAIYLHVQPDQNPQEVLLYHLNLTFSPAVEKLNITDHAAQTTVTTTNGLTNLVVRSGVTITSAVNGPIELVAKDDFIMEVGAVITTLGNVVVRGDDDTDADVEGATIKLFGTIHAAAVTVYGNGDNDTVNISNVASGAPTTVYASDGDDTINVGSSASGTGGNVDGIGALLTINGEGGTDVLNVDDSGDGNANTGVLTATTITGLDMGGSISYGTFETLNIGLGTVGDVFTIVSTHAGATNLNANAGADVINVQTIAGITTVDGGTGDETFNVGSNAAGTISTPHTNTGGTVNGLGASLTLNGNAPTSGSDWLYVDDSGDTLGNTGVLTFNQITGLGMAVGITYENVEHLIISLGSGGDTFTINSTHGAATIPSVELEETILNTGAGADTVHINDATDLLYVNGDADADTINVNGTGAGSEVAVNAGDGADTVNINGVTNLLVVNGQADADTVNVNGTGAASVVTLNAGAGTDTVNINGVSNLLTVNGQAEADTVNVNNTGVNSVSTLNGELGNDIFNVRAMDGTVTVNGGDDNDTVNVGSLAPAPQSVPTVEVGTIDAINGLLAANGGNGSDVMNVDDSNPAVTDKSGTLTGSTVSGLALEHDLGYSQLETLNIWLASGNNTFTINSTHAGSTTVSTAAGNDTVDVNGASGTLTINAEAGNDTINVRGTGVGSQTFVNGQEGNDTVNLSDHSSALPDAYPAVQSPPAADTEGNIDAINGLIVIDGGLNSDVINIDDSRNTANKAGTLTATTLRGLEMEAGVNYSNAEYFNLWLGTGTDGLYIDSTHAGTTDVFAGDGNATVNQRDDTIAIKSIGGVTTVHGQRGNDFFYVNVQVAANDVGFYANFKLAVAAAANDDLFNTLFQRTHANGIAAVLNLHGEGDTDQYTVNLAGQGNALINAHDYGAPDNGVDTLIVNGADVVDGVANQPNDTFLLRQDFVALLNASVPNGAFDRIERVNYDENINARLIVNGLGGNDKFVADDNSSITTLDGGDGDDTFQIGQVFGTPRTTAAGLTASDTFDTTPIIIGIIRDPVTHAIIFDPTSFDPVFGELTQETIDAINVAIAYQAAHGGQALDGVAYVSSGVTHATTVFGGAGADTFNVYHNKATLRLEGEADNDEFIVRAFVTLDLSVQGDTEVNGGDGTDTINYAINAPVSINGGAGFDKVVVLGTPFNDNFVITSKGIFGANLNVTFVNVESAELDALEGNDTIYILGTSPDIVTTVIGGLGSDTIEVLGDVMLPIVSQDPQGNSGVITQGLTSNDPEFDNVGVNGVAVSVLSASGDSLVNIQPTGAPLLVAEGGAVASYFIKLVAPDTEALALDPIYLTVSAGVVSGSDRRLPNRGEGVLVSRDGVTFTNALVLTFDGTTANSEFQIWVRAFDDLAQEGPRVALISHSINSDNQDYDDLSLIDIFVNVTDNDQPGLDLSHLGDTFAADTSTEVLEGTSGFTDAYSVVLTKAPKDGETVTVTFLTDGQVTALSQGGLTYLTFNAGNWNVAQRVFVTAVDDGLDGIELSTIRHQITTNGPVYSGFVEQPKLTVTVYDNETPGVVVQETDGSTVVVQEGADDSYRVRLTGAPDSNVTLTFRTDKQTFLDTSAAGWQIQDESGTKAYFEYSFTFTNVNWDDWVVIDVSANAAFIGADSVLKAFPPQDQNIEQIRGPLIIEGGLGSEGANRALQPPVMLPDEINSISAQEGSDPTGEPGGIDTLNIFHTDNTDADIGRLYYRTVDGLGHTLENPGLALVGFEMGDDLIVNQGSTQDPDLIYYGGGITYNGFEIVELLLGKGNETLTIDDTGDRDEKDPTVTADPATITAIHGGGGSDTIVANNRGEGPLVVYGDTSEDGVRYNNNQPAASVNGTKFNNPGNDTIDASLMPDQADGFVGIVIYGGAGNDTLYGSQDDDHLAGGSGDDTIHAGSGNDHIYSDSSFNVNLLFFVQDQITPFNASNPEQLAKINGMFAVTTAATSGADTINGDTGNDIIFGDHGVIDQVIGTRRITTTGAVTFITTTQPSNGLADTIYGGSDNDIIFGGNGGDTIAAGEGNNIILGDLGYIDYVGLDADPSAIDRIVSTETTSFGGSEIITSGGGQDIIIGGRFGDMINAGNGDNLVIGDSGRIAAATTDSAQLSGLPITLGVVETIEYADGGSDTITTGSGKDIIVGGAAGDDIRAGDNNDVVHGDNALISYVVDSSAVTLDVINTLANSVGGADTIRGEGGDDVLIGGAYGDRIDGGSERDLIFGDNVRLDRTLGDGMANARYRMLSGAEGGQIYSTIPATAGSVLVTSASQNISGGGPVWEDFNIQLLDHDMATESAAGSNFGNDYIAGGAGNDQIFGELGNDIIQGDGSIDVSVSAQRLVDGTLSVLLPSMEASTDGDDYIEGNGGNDVIFGNLGQDDIIGGSSNLFSLTNRAQRPDGADLIFGGAGTDIARDNMGDGIHGRDADMILGDNGNIYRIVGTAGFNYDNAYGEQIVVRAAQLLDYTPGGADYNAVDQALDIGAADELHGESGDDFIFAQVGNDVLFGEGQDDAIVGGYGNDWISGGTGDDGILGDDGRIFASRNSAAYGEPIYGIAAIPAAQINELIENSSGTTVAMTNVNGALKYTADLTPYSVDPTNAAPTTLMPRALYANDIIYGGQGNDTLHGGAGEDAISGAEAPAVSYVTNYTQAGVIIGVPIRSDYAHPVNPGNVLGYNPTTTKFALYDANDPLRKILLTPTGTLSKTGTGFEWALNFNENEGPLDTQWIIGTKYAAVATDGDDVIFGDLGHDWMVGGTGRDTIWAGWGDDLANIDDKLTTGGGLNNAPDTNPSWEDFTYGGAGRDVLIGNTGGDRMVDWNGEQNTFAMPYNPFGLPAVSRGLAPDLEVFMTALSKSQGADPTLAAQYGGSAARNGEPFGELGMVRQGDAAMDDQNGGPRDPQSPLSKSKQDVKVSAGVQPLWETAAGPEIAGEEFESTLAISDSMLATVVNEAKLRWIAMLGVGDIRLAALDSVVVQIGNLPGDRIGATLGYSVYIDSDAAGRGWQDAGEYGRMDLLTVVMHELGHVLGFDHDDADTILVMQENLDSGMSYALGVTSAAPLQTGSVIKSRDESTHGAFSFGNYSPYGTFDAANASFDAESGLIDGGQGKRLSYGAGKTAKSAVLHVPALQLAPFFKDGVAKRSGSLDFSGRSPS
jgi:Ca2+-binding RTX toxin-like protein